MSPSKPSLLVLALLFAPVAAAADGLSYEVDVREHADDLFHVTLVPGELTAEDRFLDFVAFAPGVHSVCAFGRFVRQVAAFDAAGNAVAVEQVDPNRWELADPAAVTRIEYEVEDSFDAEDPQHRVMPAAGTGIEDTYVLLNTHGVLGYFENKLNEPVELTVLHPEGWIVGTALEGKGGVYRSPSYRELVDHPLLLGELTTAAILVGDIEVEIYVASPLESINAEEVLLLCGENLEAIGEYLGFAPVERYVFLMTFLDPAALQRNRIRALGALEHTRSSVYATIAIDRGMSMLPATIAHEFMHVLTPLHLRSTIIAEFDYSIPTSDDHLWLYEGVTEWSAHVLRLRAGVIGLDEYLRILEGKIRSASRFGDDYSLARLSREWSTPEGLGKYGNIYQQGALTAGALDLLLLRLSDGRRGLREVFLELIDRYGRPRPFDNDTFLGEFVAASHPEVREFFERYVQGTEPLPYTELFEAVGIQYDDGVTSPDGQPHFSVWDDPSPEQLALREAWTSNLPRE